MGIQTAPTYVFNASSSIEDQVLSYFQYYPNKTNGVIFLALFLAVVVISTGLNLKFRSPFMFVATATAALEAVGYIARILMLSHPSKGIYILMQVFLIVTPTLLAVLDYMIVGRLITISGVERVCYLKPDWIARFFGASDVLSLLVQSSGAAMLSSNNIKSINLGINLVLTGLILQLAFFACFTAITIYIHSSASFGLSGLPGASLVFGSLYASVVLLAIRNVFRVAEFKQGFFGYLATHEQYLFAFDSSLVLAAVVVLVALHAGYLLPRMAVCKVGVEPQKEGLEMESSPASTVVVVHHDVKAREVDVKARELV